MAGRRWGQEREEMYFCGSKLESDALPHSSTVMNGGDFYNAIHVMLSEFGGNPAGLGP